MTADICNANLLSYNLVKFEEELRMKTNRLPVYALYLMLTLSIPWLLDTTAVRAAYSDFFKNRIVLIVEEGETIELVPPSLPTGTSGPISRVKFGPIGSYVSSILSGEPVSPNIIEALTTGASIAGPVSATYSLPRGEIEDVHMAWLTLSPEEPKFAEVFDVPPEQVAVLISTGDGIISVGTGRFSDAVGTSTLYLKIELPFNPDTGLPIAMPIARAGQFVFEFND